MSELWRMIIYTLLNCYLWIGIACLHKIITEPKETFNEKKLEILCAYLKWKEENKNE